MAMSFTDQINAAIAKTLEKVDKKIQSIAFEFFMSVVLETPKLTGALKNNWFPNNGAEFSAETTSALSEDGHDSKVRIYAMLGKQTFFMKDGVLTMANNLPYAYRAEVLGWPAPPEGHWSGKAGPDGKGGPYAMVDKSVTKIASHYK